MRRRLFRLMLLKYSNSKKQYENEIKLGEESESIITFDKDNSKPPSKTISTFWRWFVSLFQICKLSKNDIVSHENDT